MLTILRTDFTLYFTVYSYGNFLLIAVVISLQLFRLCRMCLCHVSMLFVVKYTWRHFGMMSGDRIYRDLICMDSCY